MQKERILYVIFIIVSILFGILLIVYINQAHPDYSFLPLPYESSSKGLVHILEYSLAVFMGFLSCIFFVKRASIENETQKGFFKALALFFLFAGISQGLSLFNSLLRKSSFNREILPPSLSSEFNMVLILICLIILISMLSLSSAIDKYLLKKENKKIAYTANLLAIILNIVIFLDYIIPLTSIVVIILFGITLLTVMSLMLTLSILYFKIGIAATKTIRKSSFIIGIGYLMTFFGLFLYLLRGELEFPYNYMIFLVINVTGLLILVYGYLKPKIE